MFCKKYMKYEKKIKKRLEMYGGAMSQILEHVYLGTIQDVNNERDLRQNNIKHVISVGEMPREKFSDITYIFFNIPDLYGNFFALPEEEVIHERDMNNAIDESYHIIESAVNSGENILIHCRGAMSRSPTILIGYLMKKNNMTLDEAIRFVQQIRTINHGDFLWKNVLSPEAAAVATATDIASEPISTQSSSSSSPETFIPSMLVFPAFIQQRQQQQQQQQQQQITESSDISPITLSASSEVQSASAPVYDSINQSTISNQRRQFSRIPFALPKSN
jgi:hypothetical protein